MTTSGGQRETKLYSNPPGLRFAHNISTTKTATSDVPSRISSDDIYIAFL